MKHRHDFNSEKMEHHPRLGIGLFFILLGATLLVATNDLLHLGPIHNYFTWETALIFIGMLLLLNLHFTGGLLLIACGTWFFMDDYYVVVPDIVRNIFWPGVIVLLGLSFIISSFFRNKKQDNYSGNK